MYRYYRYDIKPEWAWVRFLNVKALAYAIKMESSKFYHSIRMEWAHIYIPYDMCPTLFNIPFDSSEREKINVENTM